MKTLELNKPELYDFCEIDLAHGKTVTAELYMTLGIDEYFQDDHLDPDIQESIERGDTSPYILIIECRFQGISNTDSLGGILLSKPTTIDELKECYVKDYDIEKEAINETRNELNNLYNKLK